MRGLLQMLHSYLSSTKEEDIIKDIRELKEIDKEIDMLNYIGVNPNEQYFIKGINVETVSSYNIDKEYIIKFTKVLCICSLDNF